MSTSVPGILMNVPRWFGSREFIRTRTFFGTLTAVADAKLSWTAAVPFESAKALGSTRTVIVAGVVPELGETLTAELEDVMVNGTLAPPGSERTNVWVASVRSQKLPRKTRSSTEADKRGERFRLPTGRTSTPEAEEAYMVWRSLESTARPARCSGNWRVSRSVRLSASRTVSTGGSARVCCTSEYTNPATESTAWPPTPSVPRGLGKSA